MQVLLFYPDGKRSSSTEGLAGAVGNMPHAPVHAGGGGQGQHFVFGVAGNEGAACSGDAPGCMMHEGLHHAQDESLMHRGRHRRSLP